jgi:hypothetical protein
MTLQKTTNLTDKTSIVAERRGRREVDSNGQDAAMDERETGLQRANAPMPVGA